jgi:hypothetical protein
MCIHSSILLKKQKTDNHQHHIEHSQSSSQSTKPHNHVHSQILVIITSYISISSFQFMYIYTPCPHPPFIPLLLSLFSPLFSLVLLLYFPVLTRPLTKLDSTDRTPHPHLPVAHSAHSALVHQAVYTASTLAQVGDCSTHPAAQVACG